MKYMKRAKIYKASNVTFDPETKEAVSYSWWTFTKVINGKLVFNNWNYSPTTVKHQMKVMSLLDELGIKVDLIVLTTKSLNDESWRKEAIDNLIQNNKDTKELIDKPRSRKATNERRALEIEENLKQIELIKEL